MGQSTSQPLTLLPAPSVTIPSHGEIKGVLLGEPSQAASIDAVGVKSKRFLGVPYALPPTGARRWKKPHALPASFRYDADGATYADFKPYCLQPAGPFDKPGQAPAPSPNAPKGGASEDCLYLNIWTPVEAPPKGGWPVLFYIHGGWLQIGNAAQDLLHDPTHLIAPREKGGAGLQAIVVSATYRLNVFGFLAHEALVGRGKLAEDEAVGNFGFWDQKMALDWTVANIAAFGGDPSKITVSGLSAGAHSAHSQLLHHFTHLDPTARPPFRRLFMQSNAATMPVKRLSERVDQFHQLCSLVGIPADLFDADKVHRLRDVDAQKLVDVIPQLDLHTFRAVSDDGANEDRRRACFVDADWGRRSADGELRKWCAKYGISFVLSETSDEKTMYRLFHAPRGPHLGKELQRQLSNYYPDRAVARLRAALEAQDGAPLDTSDEDAVLDLFERATSQSQVYAAQRLFVRWMSGGEEGERVSLLRCHIAYRSPFLDDFLPRSMGVTHSADDALWWFSRDQLVMKQDESKASELLELYRQWLAPFAEWIRGADVREVSRAWYADAQPSNDGPERRMRLLSAERKIDVIEDKSWHEMVPVVDAIEAAALEA